MKKLVTEKNEKRMSQRMKYWLDNSIFTCATDELSSFRESKAVMNGNRIHHQVDDTPEFRGLLRDSIYQNYTHGDCIMESDLFIKKFDYVWERYSDDLTALAISEYHKGSIYIGKWEDLVK